VTLATTAPFPVWTMAPFAILVLCIAVLPLLLPRLWAHHAFQVGISVFCALPIAAYLVFTDHRVELFDSLASYGSFVATIAALYVVASGIYLSGDIEATPAANTAFLVSGAVLASLIGTTGASVLLIRPVLRSNQQRVHRAHLVPFFILAVSNVGGLLTPLGDPPLLLGYLEGVPFLWTLGLAPYWLLYVGGIVTAFIVVERRAYAREARTDRARDHAEVVPLSIAGRFNGVLLFAIVGAVLLPPVWREFSMVLIAAVSYLATSDAVHQGNGFSWGPIVEVAALFLGLFTCLAPIEANLAYAAPTLPLRHAWQLFWGSGALSAVLDNAPTYAAFAALARGLGHGQEGLVAGIAPIKLAAISVGSVVMGATTYIGNGPNLMVKSIAERAGYAMPSFARYAAFALVVLVPLHLVTTLALAVLD
jgi:Na+/H+ antiporter NhaD/arsenite permease-like protein